MNHWRVRRCYGFGVGHVLLLPRVHRHPPVPDPFFLGLRKVSREMFLDDRAIRRLLTTAPVFAIALAVLCILIAKLVLVPSDYSDIEVVLLRTAEDRFEPVPQPLPEPVVEVEPPRPAPQVAEVPAAVKPPEPAIEIPTPKPAPRTRVAVVVPPPPRVRPELALPSLPSSVEEPSTRLSRPRPRTSPEVVAETRLRPAPTMAPAVPLPSSELGTRSQVVRQPSPEMRRPRVVPAPVVAAAPVTSARPAPLPRRTAHSEAPVTQRERPRQTLAAVPIALPESEIQHRAVRRPGPRPPSAEPEARTFAVAALATPSMTAVSLPGSPHASSQRSLRVQYQAIPASPAAGRTGESLSGVPLGSLAACLSDREEDSLKQKLVASVGRRRECRSPAGSYRFVETKNLNAFLMWIDRAPGRRLEDRCGELRRALHCLGGGSSRL